MLQIRCVTYWALCAWYIALSAKTDGVLSLCGHVDIIDLIHKKESIIPVAQTRLLCWYSKVVLSGKLSH